MLTNLNKPPFPWFGGKSKAAPVVWSLLGDVAHYAEPFLGGGAVLLNRPHPCNRSCHSETVNDLDGFLVNFWRAVQWHPKATARAASWPVTEADKLARQTALLRWREAGGLERLMGDPTWCEPVMAGWWAWAVCVQIGAFDGRGPWAADPVTGRIYKQARGATRRPGASRARPHISNDGQGVTIQTAREPGVAILDQQGELGAITSDHGVSALDDIDWGASFHDMTMPELIRWFRYLSARLRHVRVLNGDWSRLVTGGALKTLSVQGGKKGVAGVFLDPPYADTAERADNLYAADSLTVAHDVREWCIANGDNPLYRIVLAGYEGEHGDALERAGWTTHEWYKAGHLQGGYGNIARAHGNGTHQQVRERLWASPHCLGATEAQALTLLGAAG